MKTRVYFVALLWTWHCAHPKGSQILAERQKQGRPRTAAYGADHFYNEPQYREDQSLTSEQHFFFKKCRVSNFKPYPVMNEWACSDAEK